MDTECADSFGLNGDILSITNDRLMNVLHSESLFSGSIAYKGTRRSAYYFNFVNGESLYYILNEVKSNLKEVSIEIREYAKDAERVKKKDLKKYCI